jgi:hypothetical protein
VPVVIWMNAGFGEEERMQLSLEFVRRMRGKNTDGIIAVLQFVCSRHTEKISI